jgi:molybdate transport system permease protein
MGRARDFLAPTPADRPAVPGVPWWLLALSALPLFFLVAPLLALVQRTLSSGRPLPSLGDPVVSQALALSLGTTAVSLALTIAFGTPVAYLMARYKFTGWRVLDTLIDLPMVLPPAVAGLSLLMLFGRTGFLGSMLNTWGIDVAFTTAAVVLAQTFVAAPFYIRSARAGFESVDPKLERVAATLGESEARVFWRITVPLALPSLLSGAIMSWARGLGEFGATIMFAGNTPGRTQTMPLAVYTALESDLWAAMTIAILLVVLSLAALAILKLAIHGQSGRNRAA